MQIIGLCRFSYPAKGGFQVEHESIEERCAFLYGPARMEERFRLFETVALPCLRAQTDPDFTLVIVVGENLPKAYSDRLHDLVAGMPQVEIIAQPPRNHREVMKEILWATRRDPAAPCMQFRHDDDDAVAVDFIEKLREAARDSAGLLEKAPYAAIDFNSGYLAELGPEGIAAAPLWRAFNTAALAMHVKGGRQISIMNFAHNKIARNMPTISYHQPPMFVRTHNAFNDSRQKPVKQFEVTPLTPEQEAEFEARFAISAPRVRELFGQPVPGKA